MHEGPEAPYFSVDGCSWMLRRPLMQLRIPETVEELDARR